MLSINVLFSALTLIGALELSDSPNAPTKLESAMKDYFGTGCTLLYVPVKLSEADLGKITSRRGKKFSVKSIKLWRIENNSAPTGYAFVHDVKGKMRNITYAVILNTDGVIQGIEILKYRESHGGEVKAGFWREQFKGKSSADPIIVGKDIRNITGATISCRSVTGGVKSLTKLFAYLKQKGELGDV